MATFSESTFEEKLKTLSQSQQSIQTLALWLIHHRRHAKHVVKVWARILPKANPKRHITFFYLANDVIQNSRKKGPEYNVAFKEILIDTLAMIVKISDAKVVSSLRRIVDIWAERKIYPNDFIEHLYCVVDKKEYVSKSRPASKSEHSHRSGSHSKKPDKHRSSSSSSSSKHVKPALVPASASSSSCSTGASVTASSSATSALSSGSPPAKKKKKKQQHHQQQSSTPANPSLLDEIMAERGDGFNDPPEREELDEGFDKIEVAASIDEDVRQQIANFPSIVANADEVDDLKDEAECERALEVIKDATTTLDDYNDRLNNELCDRRLLSENLYDYIGAQEASLRLAKSRLKEYKGKLGLVDGNRVTMEQHLAMLPLDTDDVSKLPAAGELFFA